MMTGKGPQCDVCNKMVTPEDALAGAYYRFVFPMVAAKSDMKRPASLIACTGCHPKLKRATAKKDYRLLPPGRLRRILETLLSKYSPRRMEIR